jgi:hypothetical protein
MHQWHEHLVKTPTQLGIGEINLSAHRQFLSGDIDESP